MIEYDIFYRQHGIRLKDNLLNPKVFDYAGFYFPKNSFFHYLGDGPLDEGPDPRDVIFKTIAGNTYLLPVDEIAEQKGNPRQLAIVPDTVNREFLSKNRFFKRMNNLQTVNRDTRSLIVCNYGLLAKYYNYPRSIYSYYNEWWNKTATLVKTINELAANTSRQHFIFVKLPKVLPTLASLQVSSKDMTQTGLKTFNNSESLFFLELWKWLGSDRDYSIFKNLSKEAATKTNIVFIESGKWTTFNLGLMNNWRKATKEELEADANANKKGIDPRTFAKVLLGMSMNLVSLRLNSDDVKKPVTEVKLAVDTDKKSIDEKIKDVKPTPVVVTTSEMTEEADNGDSLDGHDFGEFELDDSIAQLNKLSDLAKAHDNDESDIKLADFDSSDEHDIESGVQKKCDDLAEQGSISAAQYKAYNELAGKYKTIPAPDGNGTLADFIVVKEEDVVLPDVVSLDDIDAVPDKTMLQSSLMEFDKRYITKVMQKDVASMVLAIQNAGIAVTEYEVEKHEDIGGAFNKYTVRVSPVEGSNSTIRFELPDVKEDGTFKSNGTKYTLRKQRGELVIRKISKDTVALSSYYGKVFISRSERRVNNYANWLTNQLMSIGLDDNDLRVTSIYPGDVFDNTFKCPRAYSMIASRFSAMDISKITDGKTNELFTLNFDHTKRNQKFGEDVVKKLEADGMILFGLNSTKTAYLLMDKNDVIYRHDGKGTLSEIGYLDEYLGLETEKSPVDVAEIRLMGKTIPVGVLLAYQIGLTNLMKLLKVTPRRVEAGKRLNLQPHEYSIVFSDETLVFSKYDKQASMILAGFNNFHAGIREYNSFLFDKPDVYLNVLETANLTARYLREIDFMDKMFIDPISRKLLIQMKEPTTFKGLLMRSCELLITDDHPDAFDGEYIRTKGYERMAGAVYTELVKSIRAHNGRAGKSKLPLDFNPHAVWRAVAEDPSISLVSDINPVENLKQIEAVTFSGTGGRNSRSMTKNTRSYHKNDMGVISEATVDSGDVGINTYTSANPQFTNVYGISRRYDKDKMGSTALVSTSALLSPSADRDD